MSLYLLSFESDYSFSLHSARTEWTCVNSSNLYSVLWLLGYALEIFEKAVIFLFCFLLNICGVRKSIDLVDRIC
jgi:hypothetical protein